MAQQGIPPSRDQANAGEPNDHRVQAGDMSDLVLEHLVTMVLGTRPDVQALIADMIRTGELRNRLQEYMRRRGIPEASTEEDSEAA
jgi:hypothetical protein